MKKFLLAATALASLSLSASAQTRMTLHEEFTGENCPPCASTNPAFWALCNSGANPSKLIHIAYMVDIPSSGWYYMRNKVVSDTRRSYYGVTSAPHGKYNGNYAGSGHPASFTQAHIDALAAVPDSFNVSVSNTWSTNYDSIITTVTVTALNNWNPAGSGAVKLRAALVQNNDFPTAPGSNGEKHFENVVQAMYPDAGGTTITSSWTSGMTQTYTIKGAVPSYVDKSDSAFMVVWLQDENNKWVLQSGRANYLPPLPNDAAITGLVAPSNLICAPNGPYSVASHEVVIKNTGGSTLTSATIYTKIDGGAAVSTPWTGSLAPGASTTFTMPAASVTVAGALYHSIYDSVASPNGVADANIINNPAIRSFFIESNTALAMPYSTSYETADAGKFYTSDNNNNGGRWSTYNATSGSLGHTGSQAAGFLSFNFPVGEEEIITLPKVATSSPSAVKFWVAYKQYDATTDDKLEVVYSTDCGMAWTSLWSAAGSALSTGAASTTLFVPTAANYVQKSVNLSAVPAGAIVAFRATSDFGNNIWIDDVNIASTTDINEVNTAIDAGIYPNPAKDNAVLTFNLNSASDVNVQVVDAVGRTVQVAANGKMNAGVQTVNINTSALATGVYSVIINTDGTAVTKRLSVVK